MTGDPQSVPRPGPSRVLYVVARDRLDLYATLRASFTESSRLGIVLDRRETATDVAGPREDDRRRLAVDEALRTRGWARVRIEPDGRATLIEGTDPSPETT